MVKNELPRRRQRTIKHTIPYHNAASGGECGPKGFKMKELLDSDFRIVPKVVPIFVDFWPFPLNSQNDPVFLFK